MSDNDQKPGFLQIVGSVLSAFIGVQSSERRERDFKHGKVKHYIIVGLVMTVLFILAVVGVVRLVLSSVAA